MNNIHTCQYIGPGTLTNLIQLMRETGTLFTNLNGAWLKFFTLIIYWDCLKQDKQKKA